MTIKESVTEAEESALEAQDTWSDVSGDIAGGAMSNFPLAVANIRLDSSSPLPIHEQICQGVRSAISSQELPSGTLLPPSRELAQHLGVARNTVVYAYSRLVAEGLCVSNTRRGTRVASDIPSRGAPQKSGPAARGAVAPVLRTAFLARNALETSIDRVASGAPFALNVSDPVLYPRTKLGRRVAGKFLGAPLNNAAVLGSPGESCRFQTGLAAYLRTSRGVVCEPSQIIAVAGLEGALELTTRVLLDPGDTVLVQDPNMDVVHGAISASRANMLPMPSDAHGADPSRADGPPARLMVVSPSVSFPSGVQMSERRRKALLEAASAQNAVIFENDAFSELRFSGARMGSIQGMDGEGRVIYYSGFTETLSNFVNVGYLVVPPSLVDAFVEVSRRISNAPMRQLQDALAEFVEDHEYAVHARNVRSVFAKRLDFVKQACKAHLPQLRASEPQGGLFLVIHGDDSIDVASVCEEAATGGLPVRPLSRYFVARNAHKGMVFGFGALSERSIRPAFEQLAAIVAKQRRG